MKSLPQWSAAVLLAAPLGASALGLGDIELQSALNQPFRAEIRLSATPDELEGLRVGLASRETFARFGLDRSAELSSLRFEVTRNAAGQNIIRITSTAPIVDPFVTMLVEVTHPAGRALKEYTVLLDPPVFTPRLGDEPPIRQAEAGGSSSGAAVERPPVAATTAPRSTAPAPEPQAPEPARAAPVTVAPPVASTASSSVSLGGTYGPVRGGETLWGIATRLRPSDVTMNQMLVALFEANPDAFAGNMNVLLRGATLSIPDRARLLAMSAGAATAEVSRQETAWAESRAGGVRQAQASGDPAGAGGAADVETQQARLRLVPPSPDSVVGAGADAGTTSAAGAGGAPAGAADAAGTESESPETEIAALDSELDESRRLLALPDAELQALQNQVDPAGEPAAVEPEVGGQPGVDLGSEQLFVDEASPDDAAAAGGDAAAGSEAEEPGEAEVAALDGEPAEAASEAPAAEEPAETQPAAPVQAAAPIGTPPARIVTPEPAPSLLSRVLGLVSNPFLLIGVGVGAVLLATLWYLRHRREDVDDVTGRWDALEAEVEEEVREATTRMRRQMRHEDTLVVEESHRPIAPRLDEDFSFTADDTASERALDETLSTQTVINLDQGDSIAEADFHMAYGLYDQAAELVLKALESEPHRRDLKLKLLEVYFVWGNKDSFREAARDFKAEIGGRGDGDWDKVLIMGKQLCPDDALFAEAAAGGAVDVDLQAGGGTELDFAFDEKDDSADVGLGGASSDDLDLELATTGKRIVEPGAGVGSSDDDFDLGGDSSLDIGERTAAGLEAALFAGGDDGDTQRGRAATDDTGSAPGGDLDSLAITQESPSGRSRAGGFDEDDWTAALGLGSDGDSLGESPTVETPTVETGAPRSLEFDASDAPTVETPTIETAGPDAPTVETPTLETAFGGTHRLDAGFEVSEDPTAGQAGLGGVHAEHTEEIDLDDLGLSVDDLAGLPDDVGDLPSATDASSDTREQRTFAGEDDLLSATGVTEIIDDDALDEIGTAVLEDQDATMMAPGFDDTLGGGTEVIEGNVEDEEGGTSLLRALDSTDINRAATTGNGLDLDLDDLAAALSAGDTAEQRRGSSFEGDVFGQHGSTPVDLDVGYDFGGGDDDPTGTEDVSSLDPHTMTEIGTKLDLARAYIDMGDPEGARSILEEVLDEGDAGQRREAQGLIDALAS